jgi:hypothetical protein
VSAGHYVITTQRLSPTHCTTTRSSTWAVTGWGCLTCERSWAGIRDGAGALLIQNQAAQNYAAQQNLPLQNQDVQNYAAQQNLPLQNQAVQNYAAQQNLPLHNQAVQNYAAQQNLPLQNQAVQNYAAQQPIQVGTAPRRPG